MAMDVDTSNLPISTLDIEEPGTRRMRAVGTTMSLITHVRTGTFIPSLSSIAAAKEKRTRLRAAPTPADDYISLSLTKAADAPAGPHPDSRLVREEDEFGEGDDGTVVIPSILFIFSQVHV
jgi:hypothetical protein